MKRKPAIPFKLERSGTGRYAIATLEAALELRDKHPAKWLKLPAQLRREAKEYTDSGGETCAVVKASLRNSPLNLVHPKLRALAKVDKKVGATPMPDALAVPDAVADNLKVPGHKGRFRNRATAEILRQVRELLAEGKSQHQIAKRLGLDYHALRSLVQRHLKPRS